MANNQNRVGGDACFVALAGAPVPLLALFAKALGQDSPSPSPSPISSATARARWRPTRPCRNCAGCGRCACEVCGGRGVLERGGFARRNPVRLDSLVGSKWTAVQAIEGRWRHFICAGRRGKMARTAIAKLSSTCGPRAKRIHIEVPVTELKQRTRWAGGWVTLEDINNTPKPTKCSACRGNRTITCPRCDGRGKLDL